MILDYHNFFDKATPVKATRLVIYDNLNNPIALFIDNSDSVITCVTAADSSFAATLEQNGITPPGIKKITLGG
jgi:hypothetical protein